MDVIDLVKLGENYVDEGDIKNARLKFLDALALAPEDPQMHNRLGMLEISQGCTLYTSDAAAEGLG